MRGQRARVERGHAMPAPEESRCPGQRFRGDSRRDRSARGRLPRTRCRPATSATASAQTRFKSVCNSPLGSRCCATFRMSGSWASAQTAERPAIGRVVERPPATVRGFAPPPGISGPTAEHQSGPGACAGVVGRFARAWNPLNRPRRFPAGMIRRPTVEGPCRRGAVVATRSFQPCAALNEVVFGSVPVLVNPPARTIRGGPSGGTRWGRSKYSRGAK